MSQDECYRTLLTLAEGFRTCDPPDIQSTIQCLLAILNLPPEPQFVAKTHLQIGKLMLFETENLDYARSYLEKSLQATRDFQGDPQIEEVKFEAASLLALVYEKQKQTQASINLLQKCLEHSTSHMQFHCRLLFQLARTYANVNDWNSASAILSKGADYAAAGGALYGQILFLLSKGMMLMISGNSTSGSMQEVRQTMTTAWQLIESLNGPLVEKESLKVFFLLLQVCHMLNCGQVKSVKGPLKSLQLAIQSITSQQDEQQQQQGQDASSDSKRPGDRFIWLPKDHMCILVYLVTVLHSMQAGYMDKALKYTEKALMQIESLKQTADKQDNLLNSLQLMLLEHVAMCRLVMGQRGTAIKETVQALHICNQNQELEVRHKPVIQTLLALYAMSLNRMPEAEKQLSAVLRNQMISSDLRIISSLNLSIVYLRMNREQELSKLLSEINPEQLPSQSQSLKAASFYVMGLNAFFKARYPDAKRFLRETLKIANSEDLNRLTSCSLVLLGHIFYSQGSHRESMNMVTPAMQLASKIPDIQIQLWATALLKDLSRDEGNLLKEQEYTRHHQLFQQQLYDDSCQAANQPEHQYIGWLGQDHQT